MKAAIFIVITFLLSSCENEPPKEMVYFANRLISNPDLIYTIQDEYPDFIVDSLFYHEVMKNQKALNRIHKDLVSFFNKDTMDIDIYEIHVDNWFIDKYRNEGYNVQKGNCFEYSFVKNNRSLLISFLKLENRYILFYVATGIDDPYRDGF